MHLADLADELGVSTVAVTATCASLGIDARWAGAEISDGDADRVRQLHQRDTRATGPDGAAPPSPAPLLGVGGYVGAGGYIGASEAPVVEDDGPPPGLTPSPSPAAAPVEDRWAVGSRPSDLGPLRPGQRGQRDAMVATGIGYWWRSVGVTVATWVIFVITALVLGDSAVLGDAYNQNPAASRGKLSGLLAMLLFGLAWTAYLQIRGAISSLDGWNRIGHSHGRLHGHVVTAFLVFSSVCACCWTVWVAAVGVTAVVAL